MAVHPERFPAVARTTVDRNGGENRLDQILHRICHTHASWINENTACILVSLTEWNEMDHTRLPYRTSSQASLWTLTDRNSQIMETIPRASMKSWQENEEFKMFHVVWIIDFQGKWVSPWEPASFYVLQEVVEWKKSRRIKTLEIIIALARVKSGRENP